MIKKMKKAFTITELVIVIAVIAILAAVLIPTFSNVINNAKESAALQTCTTAMKDYQATLAGQGQDVGDIEGMAFTNDGYVFVFTNGKLKNIGKIDQLMKVDSSGKFSKINAGKAFTVNSNGTDTYAKITVTEKKEGGETEEILVKDLTENAKFVAATGVEVNKKAESLYFYEIEDNGTLYGGYFTLEGTGAAYQTEGAVYARVYARSPLADGVKLEISAAA